MTQITTEVSALDLVTNVNGRIYSRTTPLARKTDCATSHIAAEKCERFRAKHEALIFDALHFFGDKGGTAKEIASKIQMTDVQVSRRLSAMSTPDRKLIETTGDVRQGCRVWKVAK